MYLIVNIVLLSSPIFFASTIISTAFVSTERGERKR